LLFQQHYLIDIYRCRGIDLLREFAKQKRLVGVLFDYGQLSGYTFIGLGVILVIADLHRKTKPE
jgi:hypothetical protein